MALLYYHQALCCQQEQIDSARVLMSIADCHIGIGRMERARDALEEALPLLLQSSADVKEMMALAHLRLGVVKSKMGIPGHMEHFHLYLDAHPDLIKPAGSHQEQQQIDDPHVRMALLAIAQDDRLRGDHHRASLMLSLLSTAIGPVHEKDD